MNPLLEEARSWLAEGEVLKARQSLKSAMDGEEGLDEQDQQVLESILGQIELAENIWALKITRPEEYEEFKKALEKI
jgi:hypothetical protein